MAILAIGWMRSGKRAHGLICLVCGLWIVDLVGVVDGIAEGEERIRCLMSDEVMK